MSASSQQATTATVATAAVGAGPLIAATGVMLTSIAGPIALAAMAGTGAAVATGAVARARSGTGRSRGINTGRTGRGGKTGLLGSRTGAGKAGTKGGFGGKKTGTGAGKAGGKGKNGLLGARTGAGAGKSGLLGKKTGGAGLGKSGKKSGLSSKNTGLGTGRSAKTGRGGLGTMGFGSTGSKTGRTSRGAGSGTGGGTGSWRGGRSGTGSIGGLGTKSTIGSRWNARRNARNAARATPAGKTAWLRDKARYKAAKKALRKARWQTCKRESRRIWSIMKWVAGQRKGKTENRWVQAWRGIRKAGGWVAAGAAGAWLGLYTTGRATGRRARALWSDMLAAMAVPFNGLGADIKRWREAAMRRILAEAVKRGLIDPQTQNTSTTTQGSPTVNTEMPQFGKHVQNTNLRAVIEAVRDMSELGGGESVHATTAHQWHYDVAELFSELDKVFNRDAEIAAASLPPEGPSHEITAGMAGIAANASEQSLDATNAWETVQGTRLHRLYSDDVREGAFDRATRPDQ